MNKDLSTGDASGLTFKIRIVGAVPQFGKQLAELGAQMIELHGDTVTGAFFFTPRSEAQEVLETVCSSFLASHAGHSVAYSMTGAGA
jgi:hypothetical protein